MPSTRQATTPAVIQRGHVIKTEYEPEKDRRHLKVKEQWVVIYSSDCYLIGRSLPASEGRLSVRCGFYPDGTIIFNPFRRQAFTIIRKRAYMVELLNLMKLPKIS